MFDISNVLTTYGYIAMFAVSLIENGVFFILPGDSMLIMAGILASADKFNLYIVMFVFSFGSLIGNIIGYEIGKRLEVWREKLILNNKSKSKWLLKIFKDEYIKEAHYAFNKYGERIVLIQRYIPMVRTFGPMVAGAVGMKYTRYITYSILGSLLWSVSLVLPAYWLGNKIPGLERHIELIIYVILGLTAIPVAHQLIKRYIRKKKIV